MFSVGDWVMNACNGDSSNPGLVVAASTGLAVQHLDVVWTATSFLGKGILIDNEGYLVNDDLSRDDWIDNNRLVHVKVTVRVDP